MVTEVPTSLFLQIIGEQRVELALLRAEMARLQAALAEAQKAPEAPEAPKAPKA